jgi:pseudouridine synthase
MRRPSGTVLLERALSKLGIASRQDTRAWILAGRLGVNGQLASDPFMPVVPETARFELDGKPLARSRWQTLLLHKPRGCVTTRQDEHGRPTVFDLLPPSDLYLHAVGRLDLATSGLLLLTNDSRLSAWLTDPKNAVPRVYVVTVRGEVSEENIWQMETGIMDQGEQLVAGSITLRKKSQRESHLTVTLHEGKNREVRRMFSACGHEVTSLKRVALGGLTLGDLAAGAWRELTAAELRATFPGVPLSET